MARVSIISTAAGTIPAATMSETTSPAALTDGKSASSVRTDSGVRSSRTVILVVIPSVPSEPTNTPRRSGPACSPVSAPRVTTDPSASTTSHESTWLVVKPYLRQCAPPEFSATLPPIVQTCWLDGSGA
jgi:hypothetical protein